MSHALVFISDIVTKMTSIKQNNVYKFTKCMLESQGKMLTLTCISVKLELTQFRKLKEMAVQFSKMYFLTKHRLKDIRGSQEGTLMSIFELWIYIKTFTRLNIFVSNSRT